ncbi:class II aldolase/adducin family protein [Egicoccus sp. AB-alg2]|uniref:class II aldolase/adducin family protein n=1 Tax=Egicoccus sp. AB-alg2 TaxID=3242693 RepID=UPI00359EB56E
MSGVDVQQLHEDPARAVAEACRALAVAGVLDGILGHISLRADERSLWVRCRGRDEPGLRYSRAADVHLVGLDGEAPATPEHRAPNELPIHTAVLRARPDVHAVVHAHPPHALLVGLADLALEPIFGAYDIPAMRLAERGVPVYPRSVLVNDDEIGREVAEALGPAQVCLLRGHGIVAVGSSLAAAVVAADTLERLCRVTVELARLGARAAAVPEADRAQLPDLGAGFNDRFAYQHLLARLRAVEGR